MKNNIKGQIIEINSNLYTVSSEKEKYYCNCRGLFRNRNLVPVVGDYCLFSPTKLLIEEILPRKNVFNRPKVSNIDQTIIVTSLKRPDFSLNLLDKFLVIMESNNIKPIICITKLDLVSDKEFKHYNLILNYYKKIGYEVVDNRNIDYIKKLLKNKTTVFTGQTGAGKSTLLNKIDNNLLLKTGEISDALGRGKHTTRMVSLYEVCEGKVMDTPGFSAIDISNLSDENIRNSFIEFKSFNCIYKDCSHTNESECMVKKAVEENKILKERYNNYIKFIERR